MSFEKSEHVDVKPIGGLLWIIGVYIIFSFVVNVISPIIKLGDNPGFSFTQFIESDRGVQSAWLMVYLADKIGLIFNAVLLSWSLLAFFQRKRVFPFVFLGYILFSALNEIGGMVLGMFLSEIIGPPDDNVFQPIVKFITIGLITGLYLFCAKRPKNTFLN